MFLNAEPHSTGTNEKLSVPLRISFFRVATSGSLPLEIGFHDLVVLLDGHLDQVLARFGGGVGEVGGNVLIFELGAEALLEPDDGAVLDQVDQALEVALDADREIEDHRTGAEAVLDHVDAHVEVGAGAVELVDEAHPRNLVLVGLAPDGLGLRLDAGDAVEHGDRAVEHAQRTLDLDGEVDVAGRVDDVDRARWPSPSRSRSWRPT